MTDAAIPDDACPCPADANAVTAHPGRSGPSGAGPAPFHVVIVGGGIGGLALAQGLKKSGIGFGVYERDRTPTSRVQGYRVHISPAGSTALNDLLPPHLFDAFVHGCGRPSQSVHFVTERMKVLFAVRRLRAAAAGEVAQHRSVSRIALRQVLLSGLEDAVHFDKTFVRYEELAGGRLLARFDDGTAAECDVLVAADGGGSRVRRQFLPHAERVDTGVAAIAGKVFLDDDNRRRIAPLLRDGMTLASGRGGYALFAAPHDIDATAPERRRGDGAPAADVHFDDGRSYLMWALGARRERLGLAGRDLDRIPGEELRSIALAVMSARAWDERLKTLVRLADPGTVNALAIRTSVPVAAWPTQRVTLIGDAIHAMTPYRGIGANVALTDAMRLRSALAAAADGDRPLVDLIRDYESGMVAYGFEAVRTSLRAMNQAITENPVKLALSRAMLRVVDRVPALKRRMFAGLGAE